MATSELPKVAWMTVWRTDWRGECLETTWRALSINNKWGAPLRPCQWDTRAPDLLKRYHLPNFTQGNWGSEKLITCPMSWESQWRNLDLDLCLDCSYRGPIRTFPASFPANSSLPLCLCLLSCGPPELPDVWNHLVFVFLLLSVFPNTELAYIYQ